MILIADSGATKTAWSCIPDDGGPLISFVSQGYNPNYISEADMVEDIKESIPSGFPDVYVTDIYFYGAGVTPLQYPLMERVLRAVFTSAETVFIAMDTLASCRALLQREAGFAAILGTGSNSCFYDGKDIAQNVKAGGFILGDEASGAYLGKRLISDFIKGLLPEAIEKEFVKRYHLDYMGIVQKVYREPLPSRFLASFSPFINEFRNHPHMANLIKSSFEEFLRRNIVHYDYRSYPVNFVGSIAFYYKDLLEKAVSSAGMRMGKVLKGPIDGLVEYHKEEM